MRAVCSVGLTIFTALAVACARPAQADQLTVVPEIGSPPYQHSGYQRDRFGPAWKDPNNHSGCNTRERVLARDLQQVQTRPAPGRGKCRAHVIGGVLLDPYTGQRITYSLLNPAAIQIDHIYPEKRAWNAGANQWPAAKRQRFSNDMSNLLAVSGKANNAKRDKGPGTWLPENKTEDCPYVRAYIHVAQLYGLPIDTADQAATRKVCN